jgi:hypothetical protein
LLLSSQTFVRPKFLKIGITMLSNDELKLLESAKTDEEWNSACSTIKSHHGGGYPRDWYAKVIASGLAARVASQFGQTGEIIVSSFRY